jgi:hypothetical protein
VTKDDIPLLCAISMGFDLPLEAQEQVNKLAAEGYIKEMNCWRLTPKGREAIDNKLNEIRLEQQQSITTG